MLHVNGRHIVDEDNNQVHFRGSTLTALYWENPEVVTSLYPTDDIYRSMSEMGANTVRLTVHYRLFEDDAAPFQYKQDGLVWLDRQIQFAASHGLYVILCLILPPGGDWMDEKPELDFSLWEDATKQERFIRLWEMLTKRYRGTNLGEAIAAFDLFNAPATNDGSGQAYRALAVRTVERLRRIDADRLFIIGKLYGTNGINHDKELETFIQLDAPNLIYDAHFYAPFLYTHQYADWVGVHGEGGRYPDSDMAEYAVDGTEYPRDITYLASRLEHLIRFREQHDVPILVSEFGLIHHCFENERGGLAYVRDVVQLLRQHEIGYTYWDFQSPAMGVYLSDAREPMRAKREQPGLASLLFPVEHK